MIPRDSHYKFNLQGVAWRTPLSISIVVTGTPGTLQSQRCPIPTRPLTGPTSHGTPGVFIFFTPFLEIFLDFLIFSSSFPASSV
jgi:hypothetical protein